MCGVDCSHDPTPMSGYAYTVKAEFGKRLSTIDNEEWDTEIVEPTGKEKFVCAWEIDGTWCDVWWDPELEEFIAQVKH